MPPGERVPLQQTLADVLGEHLHRPTGRVEPVSTRAGQGVPFRRHMLAEMARMSCDDGLTLVPGLGWLPAVLLGTVPAIFGGEHALCDLRGAR